MGKKEDAIRDCWQCKEHGAEEGARRGHFHCDRCGASILHGEDPWYRESDDEVICNRCKVEESHCEVEESHCEV